MLSDDMNYKPYLWKRAKAEGIPKGYEKSEGVENEDEGTRKGPHILSQPLLPLL